MDENSITRFEDLSKEQQDKLKDAFPGNFIVEDELIPCLNDLVDELAEGDISFERLWLAVISCATEELERLISSNFVKW